MKLFLKLCASCAPLAVIAALLYAAFYIKPAPIGRSVAPPPITRGDFMYGLDRLSDGTLLAAGSAGKIWRGDPSGANWRLIRTPVDGNLQDIACWDGKHAVAVGNDGAVIVSGDGGASWRKVEAPRSAVANKLLRVRTAAPGAAWAVGEMGTVLFTSDFGAAWQRRAPEDDAAWNDVAVNAGTVWLAGEFGRLASSTDGGRTWQASASPVKSSLMAIAFRDARNGIAVGVEGVLIATADAGRSWHVLASPTREHLFDVRWDGGSWVAVGDKGQLLKGDAGGAQWQILRASADERGWHTKVLATPAHYLMAGENYRAIAR
jgi:photosystem II stability/assembly factor-like uncharacterized protein